jgi:hypothetical protein
VLPGADHVATMLALSTSGFAAKILDWLLAHHSAGGGSRRVTGSTARGRQAPSGTKGTPSRWRFRPPAPLTVRPGSCDLPRSASGGDIDLLALRAR